MSLYSRLDRLAADVEKLNRQVTAVANSPQSQRTSVEGGSIDFNDADGNLMAIMGGQDDGSNTIRHVDGPTPPIPSGLSAHVDGPIVQVSWGGTFESNVTHDWHYLEVLAVGPNNEQLTGTINDLSGGETSLAATAQGDWFITARSVSRAGKRSLDGDAGTVAVQLVGLTGAIDAVQESANGKNTIYYSPTEPTPPELGFNNGDLWFDTSEEGNNTASVWDGNGWVSMEDARLATIIAAQEALESDLQDVQTSVDGKNKITYDPALPPASYVGAVGDTWYRTSGNSMIGFWKWDGADWVQQELSTTVIPQIDIGAGTFGALSGGRIAAHSITSDRVLIGSGGNVVPWGQITAGATYSPHEPYAPTGSTATLTPADTAKGLPAHLTVTRTSAGSWASIMSFWATPGQKLPVDEGAEYVFTVRVYSADVPRARLSLFAYNHGGSNTGNNSGVFASSTGTQLSENVVEISVRGKVPVGAGYCLPYLQSSAAGPVGVVSADLRKAVGTTLIENGAITTDKLAVGSITAESGIIESLDLGTATVGELDGIRIMGQTISGEQLSGDAIDGMVITGATIRSAATGARTLMSASGFEAYDNTGKRTFFASASTGNVSMTGELYTGDPGSERVVLDNSLWNSVEVTDPDTGTQKNVPGAGVRIGVSSSSGADIYHAAATATDGRYVDQAVVRGPLGRSKTVYGAVSSANGLPASNYVTSTAIDNSGKVAATMNATVGGGGTATRKVELVGYDANGNSRAVIRASGGNGRSNMWGLDGSGVETSEISVDGPNRSAWIGGRDSSGALTAHVTTFGGTGLTDINGSNQNPLNVNYTGTSDWWLVPFRKGGTSWGYIGSSGAMGVDDFGIQAATGKNLVLKSYGDIIYNGDRHRADYNSTTGTANVRLTTGNFLGVVSSSRRYKDAIEPATETVDGLVDRLLSVDARTWFDKNSAERLAKALTEEYDGEEPTDDLKDVEPLRRIPGVIAEELHDAGLGVLVEYNDDGLPESVMYDRLGAMLLPVVRELRDRITELERQTHV